MSEAEQIQTSAFSSLPQETLLEIARDSLLPRTSSLEIREYVHSNQVQLGLLAVHYRGRMALLEILRREILYIQVDFHECQHITNIDPRLNTPEHRSVLGEGTHPDLEQIFGNPFWHPALSLKEAGYPVHVLKINMRCPHLCQGPDTRPYTVAFLPTLVHHILALCPVLQRMQKPGGPGYDTAYFEIQTNEVNQQYPKIRRRIRKVLDLIQHLLPGSYVGTLTNTIVSQARDIFVDYYAGRLDADGWPNIEPFLTRHLSELEASLAAGAPVHEHAGLVENFLVNKLFPDFGSHGEDRSLDNAAFLKILSMFNKYACIFMDGLAEYLLRRDANIGGQSHHVLDAITDETHFLWVYFNRIMFTQEEWARNFAINQYQNEDNFYKPSKENLSLFLQCGAVLLAETRLRFAMARARRCNPALIVHQPTCYISLMAQPTLFSYNDTAVSGQLDDCRDTIHVLLDRIDALIGDFKIEATPGIVALWARAEELLSIIDTEALRRPYEWDYWPLSAGIDRRPVLMASSGTYEIVDVEHNNDVLSLIDEMRNRAVFDQVQ